MTSTDAIAEGIGKAVVQLTRASRHKTLPPSQGHGEPMLACYELLRRKVKESLSTKRLLNLIDIAIFDFLIQNGDRHRYEMYKDQILLLDNGKGLGNPNIDELDILAPLYQCCVLSQSTWQNLETVSGGSLTETIKLLGNLQGHKLATEEQYRAVERRLLKVYATIQYCIGKHGSAKVFQNLYV